MAVRLELSLTAGIGVPVRLGVHCTMNATPVCYRAFSLWHRRVSTLEESHALCLSYRCTFPPGNESCITRLGSRCSSPEQQKRYGKLEQKKVWTTLLRRSGEKGYSCKAYNA